MSVLETAASTTRLLAVSPLPRGDSSILDRRKHALVSLYSDPDLRLGPKSMAGRFASLSVLLYSIIDDNEMTGDREQPHQKRRPFTGESL